jgi:Tfp pilus assembly protein FimT
MVVVMIVAVISAVVFTRIDRVIPGQTLKSAASELVGAVHLARSQARLARTDVDLTYDLDAGTWALTSLAVKQPGGEKGNAPAERDNVPAEAETVTLLSGGMPKGIKIAEVHYSESGLAYTGQTTATFRPSGAVGEHMVVLEGDDKSRIAVFVPALTGGAFIVEGDASYAQLRAERRLK